ncbi:cytidylate kinase [Desulfuromonas thiophila]|uniref:Cytidylate kinase n=2 Tax=Desulfuromonas thiophila TaxID=57664 RepID=A0A1G7CZG3_9BACT|nr:(d)CMP kinase [Desulfuromonas thiophila]SDE44661.1 cytidylate kinase [Desulfuromonas thiophila]
MANETMIIAIDGPSGSGKSTLSQRLAQALDFVHIDTGAMYRSVALAAQHAGIAPDDHERLGQLCRQLQIRFARCDGQERVYLNGEDVSEAIRTPQMSLLTSKISASPAVRRAMVELQRAMAVDLDVVLEGRDIGTVVFPDADVKFFLSASAKTRGQRRYEQLRSRGLEVSLEDIIDQVIARDAADSARDHAPLQQAADALVIDSTSLSIEQVLERMLLRVQQVRQGHHCGGRCA